MFWSQNDNEKFDKADHVSTAFTQFYQNNKTKDQLLSLNVAQPVGTLQIFWLYLVQLLAVLQIPL